jgi:hypothetical protein
MRDKRRSDAERKAKQRHARYKDVTRPVGRYRDDNGTCSYWMCQPHKHGVEPKYKWSEIKNLYRNNEE